MFDYNEQQVSEETASGKSESRKSESGKSESGECQSGQCSCEGTSEATTPEMFLGAPSQPSGSETVFPEQTAGGSTPVCAANVDAAEQEQLWDSLVQSQQPAAKTEGLWEDLVRSQQPATDKTELWQALVRSQGVGRSSTERARLGDVVTRPAMQWTLVDLTAGASDAIGDDEDDAGELDTTDAYDRGEYEMPDYATSTTSSPARSEGDFVPELAFNDGPSPAPAPFVPAESEAPKAEEVKAKKAAAKKTTKKAAAKKKTTKAAGKKAATKKATAKKGARKPAAKKTAKKTTARRTKKSAATETGSIPLPTNDPTFPRIQAA